MIQELTQGDKLREQTFRDIGFVAKTRIINFDFNLNTTIYRALRMNAMQSVQFLLEKVFNEINTRDYYPIIMIDLYQLMDVGNSYSKFDYFFDESEEEKRSIDRAQFLNIEIPFYETEIEQFSSYPKQYLPVYQFESLHDIDKEITQLIRQRELEQSQRRAEAGKMHKDEAQYPIEHTYIDMKWLAIGEKIKRMQSNQEIRELALDHRFYSEMIVKQIGNISFYSKETVQKIIDFQFMDTKKYLKMQFWFYFLFFVCPYSLTLISDNRRTRLLAMEFCLLPQIVFLTIEVLQMKAMGCAYFSGWNIIDLAQIIFFGILLKIIRDESEDTQERHKVENSTYLKIILIMLSFSKCIHFAAVYEGFGYFVKMMTECLYGLIPFIMVFFAFINFFVVLFAVLDVEVDDELLTPGSRESLGYYGLTALSVLRNSVGKLGFPAYHQLATKTRTFHVYSQVYLIWVLYFIQILFQLVIGLNFMIAIIENTFARVNEEKEAYMYSHKAEMNAQCYQLLHYVKKLEQYRVIIFSTFQKKDSDSAVVHGRGDEIEYLFDSLEDEAEQLFEQLGQQGGLSEQLVQLV